MYTDEMPVSSVNQTIPNPNLGFGGGGQTSTYSGVSPAVIALVAMLGCAFFLLVCFRVSVKCLHLFRLNLSSSEDDEEQQGGDPYYSGPKGLDEALVRLIPIFTYCKSTGTGTGKGDDCAVCLSEFEVGETLRSLPGCKHDFHMGCVDVWLRVHSTCPLCRGPVFPTLPSPLAMPSAMHATSQEAMDAMAAMPTSRAPSFAHATFQEATGAASLPSSSNGHRIFPEAPPTATMASSHPSPWAPSSNARTKPPSHVAFARSFSVGASLTNGYGLGPFLSPSPSTSSFPAHPSNSMEGKKKKKMMMKKKGSTPASPSPSTSTATMIMKRSFSVGVGRYLSPKEQPWNRVHL